MRQISLGFVPFLVGDNINAEICHSIEAANSAKIKAIAHIKPASTGFMSQLIYRNRYIKISARIIPGIQNVTGIIPIQYCIPDKSMKYMTDKMIVTVRLYLFFMIKIIHIQLHHSASAVYHLGISNIIPLHLPHKQLNLS